MSISHNNIVFIFVHLSVSHNILFLIFYPLYINNNIFSLFPDSLSDNFSHFQLVIELLESWTYQIRLLNFIYNVNVISKILNNIPVYCFISYIREVAYEFTISIFYYLQPA